MKIIIEIKKINLKFISKITQLPLASINAKGLNIELADKGVQ